MGWVEHTIWWQVYPLGFCGAPIRDEAPQPAPRLVQLNNWLDYAIQLGASGLLLGPIFASQTHGYDTTDQFRIDPRLGGEQEFDVLVSECKQRGMRIILDGVFSHVGTTHPMVQRALAEGADSPDADLFDIDWCNPEGPRPRVFEGHSSLVRLNHGSPKAVQYTISVMKHWLARGIDGWRLDAAYSVDPSFWARVIPEVRTEFPDAWFLGEVIHGDYSQFVAASTIDSVTQYELWKSIWSSIKDKNLFELDWTLNRHNGLIESFIPNTFVGNHDVSRIASLLGSEGALTALAVLLTVGGIPSIYYGDEQGYTGVKEARIGGDDQVRPLFPWSPSELASWGEGAFRAHQDLIGLRRRKPWLTRATTAKLHLENQRYVYRVSGAQELEHLDVEIDLQGAPWVEIRGNTGQILWSSRP